MRFVILCLTFLIFAATEARATKAEYIRAFKAGDKHDGSVIVKPLDDPANPYVNQYSAYDLWCVDHYNRYITLESHWQIQMALQQAQWKPKPDGLFYEELSDPNDLHLAYTVVDQAGYVVPHLWWDPSWTDPWYKSTVAAALADQKPWTPEPAGFWSLGRIDPALLEADRAVRERRSALEYPPIPEWMVAKNRHTVLLPDGGAIFISDSRNAPNGLTGKWYIERCAADGTLVKDKILAAENSWPQLLSELRISRQGPYFRKYPHTRASGEGSHSNNLHGMAQYQIYRDRENGGALAVIDYWNDKLWTPEADGPDFLDQLWLDWRYFVVIEPQELARIYLAQQEAAAQ